MKEMEIEIAGRKYRVAHEEGQEQEVLRSAEILSQHATALKSHSASISEGQLLLISGLMTAYQVIEVENNLNDTKQLYENSKKEIESLHQQVHIQIQEAAKEATAQDEPAAPTAPEVDAAPIQNAESGEKLYTQAEVDQMSSDYQGKINELKRKLNRQRGINAEAMKRNNELQALLEKHQ